VKVALRPINAERLYTDDTTERDILLLLSLRQTPYSGILI